MVNNISLTWLNVQQRVKASSTADRLRDLATQSSDAEIKVQQLEMLRVVQEDYQKLVKELIPAAEKALDQLAEEKARFSDAHDDVLSPPLPQALLSLHMLLSSVYMIPT